MPRSAQSYSSRSSRRRRFDDLATVKRQREDRTDVGGAAARSALAQERGTPQPLLQFRPRTVEQRRICPAKPAENPARSPRVGPRLGVTGGDLPAVGKAGFERRSWLPVDDDDVVAGLAQEPGAGDADHPGAEDKDAHAADPEDSNRNRFYGARISPAPPRRRDISITGSPGRLAGLRCVCTISRFRRRNPPLLSGAAATNHRANFPEPIIVRPTLIEEKRS